MKIALKYMRVAMLIVALCLSGQQAFAFCFAPQLEVSDEYYVSDLVLTGTVIRAHDIKDRSDPEYTTSTFYTVRVDRYLRGKAAPVVRVYSENSTARFPMDLHRRYVLFLNKDPERHWIVDNCGNSAIDSKSKITMAALQRLPLKQSFVYGEVYFYAGESDKPCGPMHLTVFAPGFTKKAAVLPDCSFHIDVPPGRYAAKLELNGATVSTNGLDYKDIYCFDVPFGGSAGLAFREMSGADKLNQDSAARIERAYKSRCTSGKDLRGPIFIP